MKNRQIPKFVDIKKLAIDQVSIEGELSLDQFQYLIESLLSIEGQVNFKISFSFLNPQQIMLEGFVKTKLILECQRCLREFIYPIYRNFQLVRIKSQDQLQEISLNYEALILEDNILHIIPFLEQELILSLPMHVMHALEDCKVNNLYREENDPIDDKIERNSQNNPFEILSTLKVKK